MRRTILLVGVLIAAVVVASAAVAYAKPPVQSENHSWNGYHWARTANPFTLKLGDNLSNTWDSYLQTTSSDWSKSTVLDTTIVAGQAKGKNCRPTSGRDEVCNGNYGRNGWIGLATIWISGKHITQGTVKVNDTYFNDPQYPYNNSSEKEHVMCQEVGHTLGLDHQDESGKSLNTCMDYYHNTSDSDTKSTSPNQHDYDELATIYSHLDSFTTIGQSTAKNKISPEANKPDFNDPRQWGQKIWSSPDGQEEIWVRDFGGGHKVFNFVIRADKGNAPPQA
jgi:hypothetical protein